MPTPPTTPAIVTTRAQELELFIDRLGLRFFRGREFTPYWTSVRNGVRNSIPPEGLWPLIVPTLVLLDAFRAALGHPVLLLSTYRRPAYNAAVGGETNSYHMRFQAIDFRSEYGTPRDWSTMLRGMRGTSFAIPGSHSRFTFRGGIGLYPTFVHVDTRGYDADWRG